MENQLKTRAKAFSKKLPRQIESMDLEEPKVSHPVAAVKH